MKKYMIPLIALVTMTSLVAQEYVPTMEDLERFYKTKTLVVLEDNPLLTYNINIQEVMEKEWKVTEYDFISVTQFEEKRMDPNYSFLVTTKTTFENDATKATYNFLNLILGGDYLRINQMPEICSVPLSYSNVEEHSYIYKLGTLARFIQNHIKLIYDNPDLISNNIFKYYNENLGDIKTKILYLVEDELEDKIASAARIKKIYPYKFKLVTREEIEEAIDRRDVNVVFLHKVGPEGTKLKARCYKILIGASDAKFYYFNYHMINDKNPDGFLEKDLKKLAKKVD